MATFEDVRGEVKGLGDGGIELSHDARLLLQGFTGVSDAEAVELAVMDARWQLVLGCLGKEDPPFSQGGLVQFRERLIAADLDRRLLERTVELARESKAFDWKKVPKTLRLAVDSRPLAGAGRVEDTFNLLGHAARKIVELAAAVTGWDAAAICTFAVAPVLLFPSPKAGMDVDWSDEEQKAEALEELVRQVRSLHEWVVRMVPEAQEKALAPYIAALRRVQQQDLEETKDGHIKIRDGVAEDRQASIEDPEMRHGRKSKSKRFNGYKEHVVTDLDSDLILACTVTPANRPEEEGAAPLRDDVERQGRPVGAVSIDRAHVHSQWVLDLRAHGGGVNCKPWSVRNSHGELFTKRDFKIDIKRGVITCPAGEVESFEVGETVEFDPEACGACSRRGECTRSAAGRGRTVKVAEDEEAQQEYRRLQATPAGRQRLRERTKVEHTLARISGRKGHRARFRGVRKNVFDLRRAAAIQNMQTQERWEAVRRKAA